jgi:hypothetical protein
MSEYDPLGGSRKIAWDPSEQIIDEPEPIEPEPVIPPPVTKTESGNYGTRIVTGSQTTLVKAKVTRNRTGNGHAKDFKRKLFDEERAIIRGQFVNQNGQMADDDCVRIKPQLPAIVTIFQVVGHVSHLHREVAQNRIQIRNVGAYCAWMADKYPELWNQWNKPAFINIRRLNADNRAAGRPLVSVSREQEPTVFIPAAKPTLKPFAKRGVFHRMGA